METTIAVAVIGVIGMMVTAVLGYLGRVWLVKKNGNPGNGERTVREECREIRGQMHGRFDRSEDGMRDGFRLLGEKMDQGFRDVVGVLREIERKT